MMIQTSVVQIDGSAGCHTVICNTHFCMTEPRCPFVDPHAVFDQFVIKRPGDTVDKFFVRNARRDDPRFAARVMACSISSVMIRYGVINQQYFSALFTMLM